jgi:hypothetical protein
MRNALLVVLSLPTLVNRYEFSGPVQPPDVVVTATVTVRYRFVPQ